MLVVLRIADPAGAEPHEDCMHATSTAGSLDINEVDFEE